MDRIKDRGDNGGPNEVFDFYTLSFITEIVFSVAVVGFFKPGLSMFLIFFFFILFCTESENQHLYHSDSLYEVAMNITKLHVTLYVLRKDSESETLFPSYKPSLFNVLNNSKRFQGVY
jgi:hypothetical protein